MTEAPERPPLRVRDLDDALAVLRAAGYRTTAARRLVLTALFAAEGPVSAEHIANGLGGRVPRSDLPSTYRNLETFEALGLVRHLHLAHGPGLYALAGAGEREYLACERCGRVTSVDPGELDAVRDRIREGFGYEARFWHFPIVGLCRDCAAQRPRRPADRPPTRGDDMDSEEHRHDGPHAHEHEHGGVAHSHPHTSHEHEHVEHEHEHSHGDRVHSHPHVHERGLEHEHEHPHTPPEA